MRMNFDRTTDPHMTPTVIIFQITIGALYPTTGFIAFRFMR